MKWVFHTSSIRVPPANYLPLSADCNYKNILFYGYYIDSYYRKFYIQKKIREKMNMAISAYALVRISPNKVKNVVQDAKKIPGVKVVHPVTGPYDAIIYLEAGDMKELGKVILAEIHGLDGVIDTTTCLVVEYD
jgi:DNA-binding Lrp family transcriptional regulator